MVYAVRILVGAVLCAVLTFTWVTTAQSQENAPFPDTPENHWAYADVAFLRERGFLRGETFNGSRPLTRYEFAAAIRRIYEDALSRIRRAGDMEDLRNRIASLETRVSELKGREGGASDSQLGELEARLSEMKSRLSQVLSLNDDLVRLKRLADAFPKELAKLGVDVVNLSAVVEEIAKQVEDLLRRPWPINIQGDMFVGIRAGGGRSGLFGVDLNAGNFGVKSDPNSMTGVSPTDMIRDLHALHEIGLTVNGELVRGVNSFATFTVGNYLGYLANSNGNAGVVGGMARGGATADFVNGDVRTETYSDVTLYAAGVSFDVGLLGGLRTSLGRLGYQISPYTYRRVDPDFYFDLPRYDDGNVYFDGALVRFGEDSNVKLDVVAGRNDNASGTNTPNYQQIRAGNYYNSGAFFTGARPRGLPQGDLMVDTTLGANLRVELFDKAHVGLTYLTLDGPPTMSFDPNVLDEFNRVNVLGGNLRVAINDNLGIDAEYAQSNLFFNGSERLTSKNWVSAGNAWYHNQRFGVRVGYKEVQPYFAAPGAWGRIGFWYNPTDIKGFTVGGDLNVNRRLKVGATGEFYTGTGNRADFGTTDLVGFSTDDKVNRVLVNATYDVNSTWQLSADWEGVFWDLKDRGPAGSTTFDGGKPTENYVTLGVGYRVGSNSLLKVIYQIVDYDSKGVATWRAPGPGGDVDQAKGSLLVTQLTVKF